MFIKLCKLFKLHKRKQTVRHDMPLRFFLPANADSFKTNMVTFIQMITNDKNQFLLSDIQIISCDEELKNMAAQALLEQNLSLPIINIDEFDSDSRKKFVLFFLLPEKLSKLPANIDKAAQAAVKLSVFTSINPELAAVKHYATPASTLMNGKLFVI